VPVRKDQGICCDEPSTALALSFAHRRRLLPSSLLFRFLYHFLIGLQGWPDPIRVTLPVPGLQGSDPHSVRRLSSQILRCISSQRSFTNSRYRHRRLCELSVDTPFVLRVDIFRCIVHLTSIPIASPVLCATSPAPATCRPFALTQSAWKPFPSVQQCLRQSAQPCAALVSFYAILPSWTEHCLVARRIFDRHGQSRPRSSMYSFSCRLM
jgi:hypothetical protein